MCLAIPGQIISMTDNTDPLLRSGQVNFSGISKSISLAYVPEAKINDFVIVHAGVALSVLDADEAVATLKAFDELAKLQESL